MSTSTSEFKCAVRQLLAFVIGLLTAFTISAILGV